jgi:hypothetical protein
LNENYSGGQQVAEKSEKRREGRRSDSGFFFRERRFREAELPMHKKAAGTMPAAQS